MAISAEQALLLAVRAQLGRNGVVSPGRRGQTANEASGDTQLKEEL
jgi:hypothetical protein